MKIFIFFLTFILFNNVSYSAPLELLKADSILYPKLKHTEQTKLIYQLLNRYHYKKISFDDSLSVKILDSYIKNLDPNREYFFSSDIEFFNQHKYEMD
jgi:carboxyl-terminal processing protease